MSKKSAVNQLDPSATPVLRGNLYPHMVLDDYVARIREMRRERRARLAALKTRRQAEAYQERVLEAINRAFSPRPAKTPLNPRIAGVVEAQGFRVEKILLESRPGVLVSGNLYVPEGCGADRPLPGVIGVCGHSDLGKAAPVYQAFPQRLAAAGFVTLIIDPFNQGERDQYALLPEELRKGLDCVHCCNAHNMMGKQLELVGEFFGMWRAWDAIRALDYLLTRAEVDPRHVGVTGNSGGGTMTTWLWGAEPRFTMAAPSCFVTTFGANLENELPADNEQYPPGVLGAGLEMADFFIARAPKPSILLGQNLDFFDRRGIREAHAEIAHFYRVLGAPAKNHAHFMGPMGHGYSHHNQRAMVNFFSRHAGKPRTVHLSNKRVVDLGAKNLWCTPQGNTVRAGAKTIFECAAEIARAQYARRRSRGPLSNPALNKAVRDVLRLDPAAGSNAANPPHYRCIGPVHYDKPRVARFAVETEYAQSDDPVARIRALLLQASGKPGFTLDVAPRVTLYLPHVSAEAELQDGRLAGAYLKKDGRGPETFFALDARGFGASMFVDKGENYFAPYGFDYMFHGHGLLFGQSFLGRRVFDVLRSIDLLVHEGARAIDLVGRGQGALLAAYAALLAPKAVKTVRLRHAPHSYLAWATAPVVRWPAANFPRGVLARFDLPDVYRALGKRLNASEPWDELMRPVRRSFGKRTNSYAIAAAGA
ncbi:MAG: prolyl oligopeptidase family serine peptidase [Planctomycetes bacterium]|nr:prolyl oligopeptidase family serine peptidase [Planctomycetota bacterium]